MVDFVLKNDSFVLHVYSVPFKGYRNKRPSWCTSTLYEHLTIHLGGSDCYGLIEHFVLKVTEHPLKVSKE